LQGPEYAVPKNSAAGTDMFLKLDLHHPRDITIRLCSFLRSPDNILLQVSFCVLVHFDLAEASRLLFESGVVDDAGTIAVSMRCLLVVISRTVSFERPGKLLVLHERMQPLIALRSFGWLAFP
jgi:hypothetical protein